MRKDACPACGGQAVWTPSKQALVCPYCGTEAPMEIDPDSGEIQEIDLVKTLREMPEELRGWKSEKRTVQCRNCHAVSVFDADKVGKNCDFCGSASLVDYQEIQSPIRPQSLLPFQVDQVKVRELIRKWYASKWLAPGKLKSKALVDTVHGVYLPYWTFDAQVSADWIAESGTYYYTTETYRDSNGQTRTRQVQHVRWTPASGHVDHFFDDEPIPGTKGVRLDLLRAVEPFPTSDLVPYATAYLSGFVVEHYQVVLIDAARNGRAQMDAKLRQICGSQVPGDTYRNLQVQANYQGETFKHILVPVWLLVYDFGPKSFQVVVNGYTGQMAGEYPKSAWKIFFLVVLALLAITLIVLASR
ncbi:MAG: zinc ribbon domain-containing protein [Acidobacteria bacterium]|nr:zinc ribbon domain-containing protein [Acidobacteriota bacterium]